MIKKFTYTLIIAAIAVVSGQAGVKYGSSNPPEGYTGADGDYCVSCHASYALNSGGGSITATGLPSASYTAGQNYNFSLSISHPSSRARWGFSIAARDANGQPVGSFSSTSANAGINGSELSHTAAVSFAGTSYTFNNLRWTAPASPTQAQKNVTFYYVGNAANGNGNNTLDYIYAGSSATILPVELNAFTASVKGSSVLLNWTTATEKNSAYFIVEKSGDNQHYNTVTKINAAGESSKPVQYSFTDNEPAYFETPTFYRLQLVDRDGSRKVSQVVKVQLKAESNFVKRIYPSPAKSGEQIFIQYVAADNAKAVVEIFNMNGAKVQSENLTTIKGMNVLRTTVKNGLSAGVYSVVVTVNGERQFVPVTIR